MRIAYITSLRLPSERAYGHQVARVCDAMARLHHDVMIYAPARKNPVREDFRAYHQVDPRVKLMHVPCFDGIASPLTPGVFGLKLHLWSFKRHLRPILVAEHYDLLYTRNPALLPLLLATKNRVVIELHTIPRFGIHRFVQQCNQCLRVVALTRPMRDELVRLGVDANRIVAEGDAVDPALFESLPDRAVARRTFALSEDAFVIGYAGSLATMGLRKGVDQLVDAVASLQPDQPSVHALIAGGPSSQVDELRRRAQRLGVADRIHLLGQLPPDAVASVYAASNALVYTAPASNHPYFTRDTSPLKIFEYMASSRPVIAADLPPVWDVLGEATALFYKPGNVASLASALRALFIDPAAAKERAIRAKKRVEEHTWVERMGRILDAV